MHFLSSHKRITCFLLPLLILSLILSLFLGIRFISPTNNESYRTKLLAQMEHASSFSEFTDALFCYEVTADSITTAYKLNNPADWDIPTLTPTLSSFSCRDYHNSKKDKSEEKLLSLLSGSLKNFSVSDFTSSEKLTYTLLENHLELNKAFSRYAYYESLIGSTTGVQANLPVTLGEYPLHTEEEVKTYLKLLKQLPGYFENVIAYEQHRADIFGRLPDFMLQAALDKMKPLTESLSLDENCFTATFNERIASIDGLSDKAKIRFEHRNRQCIKDYVLPAYEKLYAYIEDTLSAGTNSTDTRTSAGSSAAVCRPDSTVSYGLASLPEGADYYALLVQNATGSGRPVSELIAMTDQTLKQTLGNVLNIALTDQNAYLYYCEHPMETGYQSPEGILEALSLMIREDYPLLKNPPDYRVKTVPDSLASSLSPAFYMIPAIDDYRNNTIYINPLYTNEENGSLFTTLAHEGFPGHLYQTVYFSDTHPASVRHILDYPGYVEGWATYVEMNAFTFLDYPLEGDSLCRLYQADTLINLALCSRIDLGVNYEGWTLEDTRKFFEDNGFNSYHAESVYTYVVEAPANYLSYFIGYLEIMSLKEAYRNQEMENYSEKGFHQKLLDIGPSDFTTLRKFMVKGSE
ncbi:MAG: DUF885 domain-containing protein [Bacteroidales bacterium]|nr:DUF885 domain-containing protein [Clostridium sp.]MCM1204467.1 DUF885 domain-containing protein [Bacteroidales bacterium]